MTLLNSLRTVSHNLAPTLTTMQPGPLVTLPEEMYPATEGSIPLFIANAVVTPKICKHTLICKIGGVSL